MTENHENKGVCPIIEEHRRKETASVLFWPAVGFVSLFEERGGLFDALGDERLHTFRHHSHTLTYRQLVFVYQHVGTKKRRCISEHRPYGLKRGHVLDNFDDTSIDEQLFSNETVH